MKEKYIFCRICSSHFKGCRDHYKNKSCAQITQLSHTTMDEGYNIQLDLPPSAFHFNMQKISCDKNKGQTIILVLFLDNKSTRLPIGHYGQYVLNNCIVHSAHFPPIPVLRTIYHPDLCRFPYSYKRLAVFSFPAGMSLIKLSLIGNNLIIPG